MAALVMDQDGFFGDGPRHGENWVAAVTVQSTEMGTGEGGRGRKRQLILRPMTVVSGRNTL